MGTFFLANEQEYKFTCELGSTFISQIVKNLQLTNKTIDF